MKILWVLIFVPWIVSLMEKKTVGSLLDNPVTKIQDAEILVSGCGP